MKNFFPLPTQLKKLPVVNSSTGDSKSTHYRKIQLGLMTRGVSVGGDRVAWPEYEIDAINRARISGFTEASIKELVRKLHEFREDLTPGLDVAAEVARIFDELKVSLKNQIV